MGFQLFLEKSKDVATLDYLQLEMSSGCILDWHVLFCLPSPTWPVFKLVIVEVLHVLTFSQKYGFEF